jgi:hypothetical protein
MPTSIIINEGSYVTPSAVGTSRTGLQSLLTFSDAIELGIKFLQGHGREAPQEVYRMAVQAAYLDIINAYDWPSLQGVGRIHLHAVQSTGSIAYNNTTRQLTLSDATWPAWVENGSILINNIICEVESYVSTTVLVLHETLNPGTDIAAGASYHLFCRWYPLSADFINFTGPMGRNSWAYGQQISMTEMAGFQQNQWATGASVYYSLGERPNMPAEKAIFLWPFADTSEPLDFTYQRRPRELLYTGQDAADTVGTVSVSAGSNAVTGSSTAFEDGMSGSVLMVGTDGTHTPTGRYGLYRFSEQQIIRSVTSATALRLRGNIVTARSAVKYVVTDPIEIETCAKNAFMRYVESHLAHTRNLEKANDYLGLAEKALLGAMAASYPVRYDPAQGREYKGPLSGTVDWSSFGA